MRSSFIYGIIFLSFLIIATVGADRKWKVYDNEGDKIIKNEKKNNEVHDQLRKSEKQLKHRGLKSIEVDNKEEINQKFSKHNHNNTSQKKGKDKKVLTRNEDDKSSEEKINPKIGKNRDNTEEQSPKKFIGRIEHGKVKVLRTKDKTNHENESEEDDRKKVCRKKTGGKTSNCNSESSEEDQYGENKPVKKIKYSIKFAHEKQKKKENHGDSSVLRLHKNGKRYMQYYDDAEDSSEEEDDLPIKKRILFIDDDEY